MTAVTYLSFAPGVNRYPIRLSDGRAAYVRVVVTQLAQAVAKRRAEPAAHELLAGICTLDAPPKRAVRLKDSLMTLLTARPGQTSPQLARQLDAKNSTVSSLLYREMLRPTGRVHRRGREWYILPA